MTHCDARTSEDPFKTIQERIDAASNGATYIVWSRTDLLTGEWIEEATIIPECTSANWTDTDTACMCKFHISERE